MASRVAPATQTPPNAMVLIGNGPSKPNPKPSMSGSVLRPVRSLRRPLGNTASSSRSWFDWSDYRGPHFKPWPKKPQRPRAMPNKKYVALGRGPAPQYFSDCFYPIRATRSLILACSAGEGLCRNAVSSSFLACCFSPASYNAIPKCIWKDGLDGSRFTRSRSTCTA